MSDLVLKLVNMSISASFIVVALLLIRLIFKKMPKWVNMVLWGLVALRLCLPISLQSGASLIPSANVVPKTVIESPAPQIESTSVVVEDDVKDSANETVNDGANEVVGGSQNEIVSTPSNEMVNDSANEIVSTPENEVVNTPETDTVIPEIPSVKTEKASSKNADSATVVGTAVAIAWGVGVVAMLIHTALSYFLIARKVKNGKKVGGNIIRCNGVDTPFIMGIIKPKIYIPDFMSDDDAKYVLAHENAHIKRRDYLWKPLGFAFLTVYWFNPIMWVAYIMLCRDIEFACDEKVIKTYGEDFKVPYSKVLIECSIPRKAITACPVAFGEIGIKSRIKNILNYKKPSLWITVIAIILVVCITVCFMTDPIDKSNKKETKTETVVSEEEITDNTTSEPTVSEQSKPTESEPETSKPTESKPTESKPTESKPKPTPGIEDKYKNTNLGGEKITIAAPWKHGPGESNSTADTLRRQRVKTLEEKYNCKFEWIVDSDIERLKTSVAAHKPYVDFFTLYTSQLPSFAINGYLQDMDKIETVDLTEEKWIEGHVDSGVFNGGHYAFVTEQYAVPRFCIVFNKTMFEKNGWTLPYDLYKQDKWTWEECLKLAKQATDHSVDRYGIEGMHLAGSSITASFGGEMVKFDKSGKPKFVGDSEECRLANEFQRNVIEKQYEDYIRQPTSYTWIEYHFQQGQSAMKITQIYDIRENMLNMNDDYGIVPVPKGSNKNGRYCSLLEDVPINVMLANNPLANEKCYVLNKYNEPYKGYDNVVARSEFEKFCRDEESVECLIDMMNYGKFNRSIWFSAAAGEYSKTIGYVNSGKLTFDQAMRQFKETIQAEIDETYNSWQ